MRKVFTRLLKRLGLVRYDLLVTKAATYPSDDQVAAGRLVFVVDGRVQKWACLRCPGGCGATIPLSLNPKRRPRWQVSTDWLGRPTVKPSVHQTNDCRCHFWITKGRVNWCEGGRPELERIAD